jgi:hypothetical protein
MKKILAVIWIICLFSSCEEQIDWEQKGEFLPRLVVEAFLTNKSGYNYVKLSFPVTSSGEEAVQIPGATVIVTDGENFAQFMPDSSNPGLYLPEDDLRAVVNKSYLLYIEIGEYQFTATANMIPVGPMDEFKFRPVDDDNQYFRINPENGNDPSMTRYIVEWLDDSGYQKSEFYHYKLRSVDVNEFFKPASEDLVFPVNARIIRQKYSLSPDHQRYVRSLLSETEWKGGWFDILPGNLHTNLSTGGVGYFAASSLIVDTVYFRGNQ